MKKFSTICICVGVALLVLLRLSGGMMTSPAMSKYLANPTVLMLLLLSGPVLIIIGIISRLLAQSSSNTTPEVDFAFWRNANVVGLLVWFPLLLGTSMSFDAGPSASAIVLAFFHILALPAAIIAIIVAYMKRKVNAAQAVFALKMPFYYGAVALTAIVVCYVLKL